MSDVIKLINQRLFHSPIVRGMSVSVEAVSIGVMWLFTITALIGISIGYSYWFIPKTPLNLLIGLALLFINVPMGTTKAKALFLISFLVGMIVEIAGVETGQIFGVYEYGSNLGLKLWGVPIMIGIYWAVLVIVTSHISRVYFDNILAVVISGASLMVGLDFLMEQMASRFDFWHFEHGLASVQNYVAWFVVAAVLQSIAYKWLPSSKGSFSLNLYFNQVVFFAVSYFLYSFL